MARVLDNDSINPGNYYDAACLFCRLGDNKKALVYLEESLKKGFRRFMHIWHDDDLAELRSLPEFEKLIAKYKNRLICQSKSQTKEEIFNTDSVSDRLEIPFTPCGGIVKVNCLINNLPLNFIFDTGASTVSLSLVEANFMMKNGYLKPSDVVGTGNFYDANGDISEGTIINLRQIDFGGLKLDNVRASVVKNQKAPLLLGQSVLGRLGIIEINNQSKKLIIKSNR